MSEQNDKAPPVNISSWAAPSEEDLAVLESLSDSEFSALLRLEIQKGIDSGISEATMTDIWQEARRRARITDPAL